RLPVYTLLIGAFMRNLTSGIGRIGIPWLHGLVMFAMYSLGVVTAIGAAWVLKKTILRGATPPFVMELPSYKMPGLWIVVHRMLEQGWAFIYRPGTLILAVSIVVWGMSYLPHSESQIAPALIARRTELRNSGGSELSAVENQIAAQHLANSYLGRMGKFLDPVVKPLGADWRIGCAAIAPVP